VTTEAEYRAMAADALAKLPDAKSESERMQLKRANGAYLKLATHGAEAAARAAAPKPRKIIPEKPTASSSAQSSGLIRRI
jgi:hypothetical protein